MNEPVCFENAALMPARHLGQTPETSSSTRRARVKQRHGQTRPLAKLPSLSWPGDLFADDAVDAERIEDGVPSA